MSSLISLDPALQDPELGWTTFTVLRTTCRRRNGTSVPVQQTLPASGCIHPGTPEMLQLLPEEDRHEEFIAIYTDFPLMLGDNPGGAAYTLPDRILWKGKCWRVVRIRSWEAFGYQQALAIRTGEETDGKS